MATFRVKNFTELIAANNDASNGDEILFESSTYTSTATIIFDKSLTFGLAPGITSTLITVTHDFRIDGQSGGTVQTWNGPIALSGGAVTLRVGTVLSGPITLTMNQVDFTGGTSSGIYVLDDGTATEVNCTLNDCSSFSTGDEGFLIGGTGELVSLTLNRCSAVDNAGEAFRVFENAMLTANNCVASGTGQRVVFLSGSGNASFTDCIFTGKSDAAAELILLNNTGNATFLRCSGTNKANRAIRSTSGVPVVSFDECNFTNNATANFVQFTTTIDVSFSDCKLTQAVDLDNNDMMTTSGSFVLKRNIIDASLSTSDPSTDIYLVNATTGLHIEGNVFISPEPTGGSDIYMANLPDGTSENTLVVHNTFVVKVAIEGTVRGLSLNGDKEVRGNIFSGLDIGIVAGGTSDYFYNTRSGYNAFYNNAVDISSALSQSTDILGLSYDPFLDQPNKDFRLAPDTAADELDPSAAFQIDYHQVSVAVRGQGLFNLDLSPALGATDAGPTDAGAYNNAKIFPIVTLTAIPDAGWVFGRWGGNTISTDNPFVFTLISSQVVTVYFHGDITPHLTSPKGGEIFNLGKVNITWDTNNPLAIFKSALLSYEIEYTDNYVGVDDTNWHSEKRRIPWNQDSYEWIVGKMIKSDSVRVRLRARHHDGSFSDWSMASGDFMINVFKLIPPAIVNPISHHTYTDFILIILDETLTTNTFNQKVRYTLEYSSDARNVDWTVIVKDIPVGQNVIRWNLEDLSASDDYVLRLTAKNAASCEQTNEPIPDQIARRFVYNLKIQQPGVFLIDTKPPQAILDVESSSGITSELTQTLTIFAEDATSDVEQIQLRECNASQQLALGDVSKATGTTDCTPIEILLDSTDLDFDTIIGKPQGYTAKTQWTFEDVSGLRRLEAMLTDSGGNNSLQSLQNIFIPAFRSGSDVINDIIVVSEVRDVHSRSEDSSGFVTIITTSGVDFEVAYIGTKSGKYWALEPFPRLVFDLGKEIRLLIEYFDVVYLLVYVDNIDTGSIYRDDKTQLTNIFDFNQDVLRIPNAVAIFNDVMYIGLENGELWSFNGVTPILVNQFANPITTLVGDNLFLYIGQANSSAFVLYNGTEFFTSDLEP